jgi:exosortase
VLFWAPLSTLAAFFYHSEYYSYALIVPPISAGLVALDRQRIFLQSVPSPKLGALLVFLGLLMFQIGRYLPGPSMTILMSATALCFVFIWMGLFLCFYGGKAWRAAIFPLLLLFFMVPLPDRVLAAIINFLQRGSAVVTYGLLHIFGIPVTREGMVLSLAGLDIEVSPQCSGIRSSIAIVILTFIAAYLYLRSGWHRLLLSIAIVPVVILKNAIRISTIFLLAAYVDRGFLDSSLHHRGGVLFFLIGVGFVIPIIILLRRLEVSGGRMHIPPTPGRPVQSSTEVPDSATR